MAYFVEQQTPLEGQTLWTQRRYRLHEIWRVVTGVIGARWEAERLADDHEDCDYDSRRRMAKKKVEGRASSRDPVETLGKDRRARSALRRTRNGAVRRGSAAAGQPSILLV